MQRLVVPDAWQRKGLEALRSGHDVIVDAPTGSGKTLVFELRAPELRGQALYTVPTRALANDKFAEWRARGWDTGILTGDAAWNTGAPVVVATLEAALHRLLAGQAPELLVIDEFQMLADPVRGGHYEIAIAAAPRPTRLLLLSGSVANAAEVAEWLRRIGREPALIAHRNRAVPLEEVLLDRLEVPVPSGLHGFWPRSIAAALNARLGPVLLFAPRRREAERLARLLASALPCPDPLRLSREHQERAGSLLARCLERRIAFHHSGLPYPVRAGLVEPLARRGECLVVVATMGLAAGIHFSLRSVLVAGTRYLAGAFEREVRPDELLQMFGRAGRRGLDSRGYVLTFSQGFRRLADAAPIRLRRPAGVPWGAMLSAMDAAARRGEPPFQAAASIAARLFAPVPVGIGVEQAAARADRPCGLQVDAERARFRRCEVDHILGPDGWGPAGVREVVPCSEVWCRNGSRWEPLLASAVRVPEVGFGRVCRLAAGEPRFGRELAVFAGSGETRRLVRSLRGELIRAGVLAPEERPGPDDAGFRARLVAWLESRVPGARFCGWADRGNVRVALLDVGGVPVRAVRDSAGRALLDPPERRVPQPLCMGCADATVCEGWSPAMTPALAWRMLGLVEADGRLTQRGRVAAWFQQGEGLAIAAALEDPTYPLEELVRDLADLRAGHRFAGQEPVRGGRLGIRCAETYGRADHPGYLEMGVPPQYGAGAGRVVWSVVAEGMPVHTWVGEELRAGDIERAVLEWRSLLRQVVSAPDLDWDRWRAFQAEARRWVDAPGFAPFGVGRVWAEARRYGPAVVSARSRKTLPRQDPRG